MPNSPKKGIKLKRGMILRAEFKFLKPEVKNGVSGCRVIYFDPDTFVAGKKSHETWLPLNVVSLIAKGPWKWPARDK